MTSVAGNTNTGNTNRGYGDLVNGGAGNDALIGGSHTDHSMVALVMTICMVVPRMMYYVVLVLINEGEPVVMC